MSYKLLNGISKLKNMKIDGFSGINKMEVRCHNSWKIVMFILYYLHPINVHFLHESSRFTIQILGFSSLSLGFSAARPRVFLFEP